VFGHTSSGKGYIVDIVFDTKKRRETVIPGKKNQESCKRGGKRALARLPFGHTQGVVKALPVFFLRGSSVKIRSESSEKKNGRTGEITGGGNRRPTMSI